MVKNTENIISQKISQYWPDLEIQEIITILNQYGSESYHKEIQRVHLAILKLSEGQLNLLKHYLEIALSDYRDVLAWAEYPEEMKLGYSAKSKLPLEKVKALRRRDRVQYLIWLEEENDD
jgi:hypothetical protein